MFTIEKRIEQYKEDGNNYDIEVCFLVDGEGKELSPSVQQSSSNNIFKIHFEKEEEINYFSKFRLSDFPSNATLEFSWWAEINGFDVNVEISVLVAQANLYIEIVPRLPLWNEPYSFLNYQDVFWKVLDEQSILEQKFIPSNNKHKEFSSINIFASQQFNDESIENNLSNYKNFFSQIHKITKKRLELTTSRNAVVSLFNFPEAVKIPCEQYLVYFAQFLQGLGINATSNLKEESGIVLFSVTPTDNIEALDKIREALAVYLNLPSSPVIYDDSFAAMRLRQQIENLEHSQKMAVREIQLAEKVIMIQSETIREKNTTISQKDSTIEQQSKIIEKISSKSIMMDSVENKDELEEICDGLKIGEFRWLMEKAGIHFNLATFVKGIGKRILGKPDEISILESNDVKEENN